MGNILESCSGEKPAKEKAAKEKAAKEKAAKEKWERERPAREKAAREKAAKEKAAREKAAKEKAAEEKAAKEKWERERLTAIEELKQVQPGLNSLSIAIKKAKQYGIKDIFLLNGMHNEKGGEVTINFALKVVGQNKDEVKIKATLLIWGKKEEDVFFSDCTVTGANGNGVWGFKNASMHLKNVCVEKCGGSGVYVDSTRRNTMTDCNVNNNKEGGVFVGGTGCMIIDGSATTIHHNVTGGSPTGLSPQERKSNCYGLEAWDSSSSIHLISLTKESISTNNGGGGNYGGPGTIKTGTENYGKPCKAENLSIGTNVNARWKSNADNKWNFQKKSIDFYPGIIKSMNTDGTYDITFDFDGERKNTPLNEMQYN